MSKSAWWSPLAFALVALPLIGACGGDKEGGTLPTDSGGDDGGGTAACDKSVDADCDGVADGDDCDPNDGLVYPGANEIPYDGKDNDCAGDGDLTDYDNDGYDSDKVEGGTDCNDGNPEIHPGAAEECYDGIDQDCDGFPAEPEDDSLDCDGDGFIGIGTEATDCVDTDASINPDATEIWYDGVDQDCSGVGTSDYDADGDGEDRDVDGGTDCDDTDATVYSGADEHWDGLDNNCDGASDLIPQLDADLSWYGNSSSSDVYFGMSIVSLGDTDGDGFIEWAVGGPFSNEYGGWLEIFSAADGDGIPSSVARGVVEGDASGYLGWDADEMGDLDGDGVTDIAVGGILESVGGSSGGIFLFSGAELGAGGTFGTGDAFAEVGGYDLLGANVHNLGDVDGDGVDDLVGATTDLYLSMLGYTVSGAVWSGADLAAGGSLGAADALGTFTGTRGSGEMIGGDTDGDGTADLIIGISVTGTGGVGVIPSTSLLDVDTALGDIDRLLGSTDSICGATLAWMEDMDGDGYGEVAVGCPGMDGTGSTAGEVLVLHVQDLYSGDSPADAAFLDVQGVNSNGGLWTAGDEGADFDGDGSVDLLVAAGGAVSGGADTAAYVLDGSVMVAGGTVTVEDAGLTMGIFTSRSSDDWFGFSALAADTEGDGDLDLWIGAPATGGSGAVVFYENMLP